MPSNLSDFNLYGSIYRYLNLVYAPQNYFEKLFARAQVDKEGKAGTVNIKARFNNIVRSAVSVKVNQIDPNGKIIQTEENSL